MNRIHPAGGDAKVVHGQPLEPGRLDCENCVPWPNVLELVVALGIGACGLGGAVGRISEGQPGIGDGSPARIPHNSLQAGSPTDKATYNAGCHATRNATDRVDPSANPSTLART